jgi:HAD superfamily hydrolase (TIGR01509 family)
MLKAVLFDVDGTLVDSNALHAEAWSVAFKHFGVEVTPAQVRTQIGKGGDKLLPVFLNEEQQQRFGDEIKKWRGELFLREYMQKVRPFPDSRALIERILRDGHKVALATSAKQQELKHLKKIAQIDDLIDEETKSDDVEESKPEPDIFVAALQKLNIDEDEAIAVGDTPWDVEACNKAHIRIIGLTCGGWSARDLKDAGAIEVFESPSDLLNNYGKSSLDEGRAAA